MSSIPLRDVESALESEEAAQWVGLPAVKQQNGLNTYWQPPPPSGSCLCFDFTPEVTIPEGSMRGHQRALDLVELRLGNNYFTNLGVAPGQGITVGVVDSGIFLHPDLTNVNLDLSARYAAQFGQKYTRPLFMEDSTHGTGCAGIIGGEGNAFVNGMAPFCKLVDMNRGHFFNAEASEQESKSVRLLDFGINEIDVYNNSWGPSDGLGLVDPRYKIFVTQMEEGIQRGRGGLGCVYLWAAGNENLAGGESTMYGHQNVPVGSINVAAMNPTNDESSDYSIMGANILCAGIAGRNAGRAAQDLGVITAGPAPVTPVNQEFNGTSSAAPYISGAAALILSYAKGIDLQLSYRDVKNILMAGCDLPGSLDRFFSMVKDKVGAEGVLLQLYVQQDPVQQIYKPNQAGRMFSNELGYGLPSVPKLLYLVRGKETLGPLIVESLESLHGTGTGYSAGAAGPAAPFVPGAWPSSGTFAERRRENVAGTWTFAPKAKGRSMVLEEVLVTIDGVFGDLNDKAVFDATVDQLTSMVVAVVHTWEGEGGETVAESSFLMGVQGKKTEAKARNAGKRSAAERMLRLMTKSGEATDPMVLRTEAFRGSSKGGTWTLHVGYYHNPALPTTKTPPGSVIKLTKTNLTFYGHERCPADDFFFGPLR